MAQVKLIKNKSGRGKGGAGTAGTRTSKATLDYVYGLAGDRPVAVSSINMIGGSAEQAEAAFEATRAAWKKRTKIEAYHWEMSFSKEELDADNPDDWIRCNEIGAEFARQMWRNRPTEIVTHIGDDGLLHNHFVVGNVDVLTGRAARGQEMAWFRAFPIHEQVLAEMGHQQPDHMPKDVDEARARSIAKREGHRDDLSAKWARVWEPQGLLSWDVAEQRAADEDLVLVRGPAPRDARGGVKKGDQVLRFKTSVNKRMETYNGRRYGVDLAEAEARIAQGQRLAQQVAQAQASTVRPIILVGGAGIFKGSPDRFAMTQAGYTPDEIDATIADHKSAQHLARDTVPEPSGTQSRTEPQAPETPADAASVSVEEQAPQEPVERVEEPAVDTGEDVLEFALEHPEHEDPEPVTTPLAEAPKRKSPAQIAVERWEAEQEQREADEAQFGD